MLYYTVLYSIIYHILLYYTILNMLYLGFRCLGFGRPALGLGDFSSRRGGRSPGTFSRRNFWTRE